MLHSYRLYLTPQYCLDEEFDAPDAAADHDLCCAVVAGKAGLHPDAWDNHDPLTMPPPRYRRPFVPPIGYPGDNAVEWKPHTPRLQKPPRPAWHPHTSSNDAPRYGALQLTCDVCNRHRLDMTLEYHGDRATKVAEIRRLGHEHGWTCIAGTDRCPRCSQAAAPKPVGNGASSDQGDKQHA
jgi:hypothetical protein